MLHAWRAARAAALILPLVAGTGVCAASVPDAAAPDSVLLEVPYLPQTEALCGGAAAAMLFRYWGEPHAGVQQFASLVDRRAGGIADTALVNAIRERGWSATRLDGSLAALRAELLGGRPPIILIEDRPQRYHYVVVVGVDDGGVLVHDPTWGPRRRLTTTALLKAWKPAGLWLLRVVPAADTRRPRESNVLTQSLPERPRLSRPCDARLDAALDVIEASGPGQADTLLGAVAAQCPDDARPLGELAAVRFTQQRWNDASTLARQALARDPADAYATNVLASSRFMANDQEGALRAWNTTGRPLLDSVRISGLSRTRYALLTEMLGLQPDALLSAEAFALARRRLESMPDFSTARLSLRPGDDGFAVVDVAVAERPAVPDSPLEWGAVGGRAILERELAMHVPGRTGQGEVWNASVRWWEHRPAAAVQFAAPLVARRGGVWHVALSWSEQTYGTPVTDQREDQLRGEAGVATWLTPGLRLTVSSGIDSWRRVDGRSDKTIPLSGTLEQRFFDDRVAAKVEMTRWLGLGEAPGFALAAASVVMQSSREPGPLVLVARVGAESATADAPLALWSGAGEGRARPPLLRAHALLHGGRIDGPIFGRRLVHATLEGQHWLRRPSLMRIGAAAFIDGASVARRRAETSGLPLQMDAGAGLRVRVPGVAGTLRVDYAHGLRDGANALTVGWQIE